MSRLDALEAALPRIIAAVQPIADPELRDRAFWALAEAAVEDAKPGRLLPADWHIPHGAHGPVPGDGTERRAWASTSADLADQAQLDPRPGTSGTTFDAWTGTGAHGVAPVHGGTYPPSAGTSSYDERRS